MEKRFHTESRTNENFTLKGLQTLTGEQISYFLKYIAKEIIDNSLEASDEPEITIWVVMDKKTAEPSYARVSKLVIQDNGPGIDEEKIKKIFQDIENFGGTKRYYKLPTRGSQGNALMTILGIQSIFDAPLRVASNDNLFTITPVKNDLSGGYEIKIEKRKIKGISGLGIILDFSKNDLYIGSLNDLEDVFFQFIELNPHADFYMFARSNGQTIKKWIFKGNGKSCHKLALGKNNTTGKVIWFTQDDFFDRIKADARVEPDLILKNFVQEFCGFSSYSKVKMVLDEFEFKDIKKIADFFEDNSQLRKDAACKLYEIMAKHTKVFDERSLSTTLGSIGEEGMRYSLLESLKLKGKEKALKQILEFSKERNLKIESIDDLIIYYAKGGISKANKVVPHYFELIATPLSWERCTSWENGTEVNFGINQSFIYSQPEVHLSVKRRNQDTKFCYSIRGAFSHLNYPFKIICNLTCPTIDFKDKGKQLFDTQPFSETISEVVGKAVRKIEKDIIPVLNKMNKSFEVEEETDDDQFEGKAPKGFIKDFVFRNFMDVYNKATDNGRHILTQRQFFYAMRKLFQDEIERLGYKWGRKSKTGGLKPLELKYSTFGQYVDEFEVQYLGKRIIYKKDRGFFVEPHSNIQVPLGTAEVEDYVVDLTQYNNILIVEKTGYYRLLHNDFQLTKRYDVGLINLEGYATNATRDLVEKIKKLKLDIKIYVLTDFDISGLGIAKNVKEPDKLSAADLFDCERIGITLEDIKKYNLPPEPVEYKKKELTELENKYERGEISEDVYDFLNKGQRVEINVFTPVELKDYLEEKFKQLGIQKLKPKSKDDIRTFKAESPDCIRRNTLYQTVGEFVIQRCEKKLYELLEKKLKLNDETAYVEKKLQGLVKNQKEMIYQEVMEELKKYPPKNWIMINEEKIKEIEKEVRKIESKYESIVKEKARNILNRDVLIDIKIRDQEDET